MGPDAEQSTDRALHWDAAYESRGEAGVSWFQRVPTASLDLIESLGISADAAVLDIGGGASTFVDHLVGRGFTDLTVLDIAENALATARSRLGPSAPVSWLREDLLKWTPDRRFDLWHDRAVLHFLVDDRDRQAYLQNLKRAIKPGGSIVIATFAEDGPEYCSGLPVRRYSPDDLRTFLGDQFKVIAAKREEHHTPALATQSFTWIAASSV